MARISRCFVIAVTIVLTMMIVLGSPTFAAKKNPPYTVAISNGFVGSEWRIQMVEQAQKVFDEYKKQGLVKGDMYVNHAGPWIRHNHY